MVDNKEQSTVMLKLMFIRNTVTLDITNNTPETVIFDQREMIGILDLRSLSYCQIMQGVLQHNMSKYYQFESADIICMQFNKFMNALKRRRKTQKKKYPWLDKDDKRKYMTDRVIMEKYIDLDKSCLTDTEKRGKRHVLQIQRCI